MKTIPIVIHPKIKDYKFACQKPIQEIVDSYFEDSLLVKKSDIFGKTQDDSEYYIHAAHTAISPEPEFSNKYWKLDPNEIRGIDGLKELEIILMGGETRQEYVERQVQGNSSFFSVAIHNSYAKLHQKITSRLGCEYLTVGWNYGCHYTAYTDLVNWFYEESLLNKMSVWIPFAGVFDYGPEILNTWRDKMQLCWKYCGKGESEFRINGQNLRLYFTKH